MNDNAQKTLARIKDVETNKADNSTVTDISNEVTTLKGSVQTNTNEVNDLKQQIANLTSSLQQLQRQVDDTRTFKFEGNYDNQATYQKSSAVVWNDQLYISLIDNNRNPLTDTLSWLRLENFAPTADLNNFYTKVQINTMLNDYLTRNSFDNEKAGFAKLAVRNDFSGPNVFTNWMHIPNPSGNLNPVNKQYLEAELNKRIPPRQAIYLKGQAVMFANKAIFENEVLPYLEKNDGTAPDYVVWGNTSTPEALCLGGKNLNNSQGNMPNGVQDTAGGDWRIRQSDLPQIGYIWEMRYADSNTGPLNHTYFNVSSTGGATNMITQVQQQWEGVQDWGHNAITNDHCMRYIKYHFNLNGWVSQTTMNIPRIAGFIVIVFSTDVYVKSNRPRIYQVPQSETTIVETPNETTIFVGEA